MKKTSVLLVILSVLILVGCASGGRPENMSDMAYDIGMDALKLADRYLDDAISVDSAHSQMENLHTRADKQSDASVDKKEYVRDLGISHSILMLQVSLSSKMYGRGTTADVLAARNSLAEKLGEKKRK